MTRWIRSTNKLFQLSTFFKHMVLSINQININIPLKILGNALSTTQGLCLRSVIYIHYAMQTPTPIINLGRDARKLFTVIKYWAVLLNSSWTLGRRGIGVDLHRQRRQPDRQEHESTPEIGLRVSGQQDGYSSYGPGEPQNTLPDFSHQFYSTHVR